MLLCRFSAGAYAMLMLLRMVIEAQRRAAMFYQSDRHGYIYRHTCEYAADAMLLALCCCLRYARFAAI